MVSKGPVLLAVFWFRIIIFSRGFKCWRPFVFTGVIKRVPEQDSWLKLNLTLVMWRFGGDAGVDDVFSCSLSSSDSYY